ncbi:MAG: FecR domain-containing protein [Desulfovibrionaceae bacterium]|jgi:Ca2+-binding RTX toxin-like protein|nr:FecR domain-containing protein [Desulfovibrionaceae bacterium]
MPDLTAIGAVEAVRGEVFAESASGVRPLAQGGPVYQGDVLVTGASSNVEVRFADEAVLSQGPDSRMSIDAYVYDPADSAASRLFFNMAQGAFRMATGAIAEQNPDGVHLRSPLAVIGIRGTTTDHEIAPPQGGSPGPERHIAESFTGGQSLVFTDAQFGVVRVIALPLGTVGLAFGQPISPVTIATPDMLHHVRDLAPLTTLGEQTPQWLQDLENPPEPQDEGGDEGGSEGAGEDQGAGDGAGDGETGDGEAGGVFGVGGGLQDGLLGGLLGQDGLLGGEGPLSALGLPGGEFASASLPISGWELDQPQDTGPADTPDEDDDYKYERTGSTTSASGGTWDDRDWDGAGGSFSATPIDGDEGVNNLSGTAGDDVLRGYGGNDDLWGGSTGHDTLFGGAGNDVVSGSDECDLIYGGTGNDVISGHGGYDTIYGGSGQDTFSYHNSSDGQYVATNTAASGHLGDVIKDYSHGEGDVIDVSSLTSNSVQRINAVYDGTNALSYGAGNELILDSAGHLIVDYNDSAAGYYVFATIELHDGDLADVQFV